MTSTRNPPKHLYCDHCDDYISKTLYYQHKRLYYDSMTKTWSKTRLYTSTHQENNAGSIDSAASSCILSDSADDLHELQAESGTDNTCTIQIWDFETVLQIDLESESDQNENDVSGTLQIYLYLCKASGLAYFNLSTCMNIIYRPCPE